jgi:6-phosphogluconolactonase (cycloisomerase 2 family)
MFARIVKGFIPVCLVVGSVGCGGGSSPQSSQGLTQLSITAINSTFATGRQAQYAATGTFSDGSKHFVKVDSWSSSNTAVAAIDQNGRVTAKTSGHATITATAGLIQSTSTLNVVTLKTKFIYVSVLAPGVNKLAGFSIDAAGQLTPLPGSPFDINAGFIATDPLGRLLFNSNPPNTAFQIDPQNGSLTPTVFSASPAFLSSPNLDPTTRFLFSTSNGPTQASSLVNGSTINLDNGALTPINTSPWQVSGEVDCYTFDSSGKFLFACDLDTLGGNSGVHAFQIDQDSGALALAPGSPFVEQGTKIQPGQGPATVGNPSSIVIGPSGNFLYAFNGDECALSNGTHCPKAEVYRIDRNTGALQVVYPEPLPVPDGSGGQIQHPNGKWVYAAGGDFHAPGQIVGVMLDDTAVTVAALPNMPVSTGLCPAQPAFNNDASRLYVVNRCDTTISVFTVNSDGSLTLEQTPVVAPAGFMAFSMAVVAVPQ